MLRGRSAGPTGDPYLSAPVAIDLSTAADFEIGALKVRPSTLQVEADGESRTIEPRVMQGLVALAAARGAVVSRDQLTDLCWGGRIVGEDALNRCISSVRRIGAESAAFEIKTIPRVGYQLLPLGGAPAAAARSGGRILPALIAILVVALVASGLWYLRTGREAPQPTIAVLPFTALDADPDSGNFGRSVADAIGAALVQTGANVPDGEIQTASDARKSGAALIVSGTVRRDGSTYRITARVDSPREGATLLTNEFEAELGDAPALPGRVAAWLIPGARMWKSFLAVESDRATTDEIMRIFLTRSAGDNLRAWKLSRALASAKPRSGAAQLVTALLTSDVLAAIASDQRAAAVASARQSAIKGASLLPDPDRALAVLDCNLTAPGWLVLTPRCDRRMRAAIAADPDVPLLPYLFGTQLAGAGRFVEAAKMVDMDLAANPLGPAQLSQRYFATRMMHPGDTNDELARLTARMRRYMGPGATAYPDLLAAVAAGDARAAEAIMNDPRMVSDNADDPAATTTRLVLRAVRSKAPGDLKAMRGSCNPEPPQSIPGDPAFETCLVGLTMLGDLDAVFALADRGYRDVACCSAAEQEQQWLAAGGTYYPRWELFGEAMAPVRADRRFIELARRTGLLAYWKSARPPDFCSFERAPVCDLLRH
jgi:TolB-like protein